MDTYQAVQYFAEHYNEYLWQVYVPIMVWMILVLAFIIILFIKYTFGNWSPENPNPYQDETFGMPRGTFRGILTLTLLWVVVVLELVNVRVEGFEQEIHELMVAFQMMIAFYFGSKVMHHMTSVEKKRVIMESNNYNTGEGNLGFGSGTTDEFGGDDGQAVG